MGTKAFFDFDAIYFPFDINLWISILVICLAVTVVFKGLFSQVDVGDSATFVMFDVLAEQGLSLSEKINKRTAFRIILASIILSGVVLSNSYKGKVTSRMTMPPPTAKINSIKEVMERKLSILMSMNSDRELKAQGKLQSFNYKRRLKLFYFYSILQSGKSRFNVTVGHTNLFKKIALARFK